MTREQELASQIVEALAAVERAENHARVLTDDSRDTHKPLVRVAYALRRTSNELATALRTLSGRQDHTLQPGAAQES